MRNIIFSAVLLFLFIHANAQVPEKDIRKIADQMCNCARELKPDSTYSQEQLMELCLKYALTNLDGKVKLNIKSDKDANKFGEKLVKMLNRDCDAIWKHLKDKEGEVLPQTGIKDSSSCKAFHTGRFHSTASKDTSSLVIREGKYHWEYWGNRTYFVKAKIEWVNECECILTIIDSHVEGDIFKKGDKMHSKILAVEGDKIYVESDFKGAIFKTIFLKLQ